MARPKKKKIKSKARKPSGRKKPTRSRKKRPVKSKVKSRVKPAVKKRGRKRKQPAHLAKGLQRYHVIANAIRKYYKDTGKELTREELSRVYAQLKEHFKNNTLGSIESGVASFLSARDKGSIPAHLIMFPWFDLGARLLDKTSLGFFKPEDTISIDLSPLDLEPFEFPFKDAQESYHKLYPEISNTLRQFTSDEIPQFVFKGQKGSVFSWFLDMAHAVPKQPSMEPAPGAPAQPASAPAGAPDDYNRQLTMLKQQEATFKAQSDLIDKLKGLGYTNEEIRKKLG